ncbi:MAG: PAS domain S-box protein [Desulfuromonadales bacterium]|nr:PAS domain S-box protein [Desulfuromonadales bacterium]
MAQESSFQERLSPIPISIIYVLVGGMWVFSTIFIFSEGLPINEISKWELLLCFSGLLVTASILYFLIRNNEAALKKSLEALHRVNRALKARSECSQVLVRATDEQELMQDVCRIIGESVGYCLAWVGLAEDDPEKTVRPVAQWGWDQGYLESVKISWGDNEHGQGPTGIAIRSGLPYVVQHILTDPKWSPWRDKALRYGYASSLSLPLADGRHVFGAMVIFASEPDAFDQQEVKLLEGLADDLCYGINSLRLRQERARGGEERRLLAAIIEQETDGILTFDTHGVIKYVNPAFVAISGYEREEIVGRAISDSRHRTNPSLFRAMEEARTTGQPRTERFINRRSDGTLYDIEAKTSPVCGPAGITAFSVVIRDLTHEVQLERQLCQAQKVEAIATLAGGIAHDFNNILAAVITNAEMAMDEVGEGTLREHLAIILKAGFRAKNLVKQILTLSCHGEGERKPLHLQPIASECLKLLRASLPATIDLHHHPGEKLGMVLADPTQMHQVIMNLCTNAADAMRDQGGVLDILLDNVTLPSNDQLGDLHLAVGRYLRLTVADTGIGMDRKTRERIFDPFFTTKEPGRGTGLGLSVVQGIVKNHGGGITFASEPGKGTTFQVYLPCIDQIEDRLEIQPEEAIPGGTERILFLDDETDLVYSCQKMLQNLGYEVVAGTNSLEALDVFKAQPDRFDLIITDQTMPNLTGDKLAREVLRLRPNLPIILCTGLGQALTGPFTEKMALSIGIRAVVRKPMERHQLATVIRQVLDNR